MSAERLDQRLEEAARRWPDRVALVHGDRRMTFSQLNEAAGALAAGYQRRGLRRGDRVLAQISNRPEHIVAIVAAWRIGAVHVGVDHDFTAPEVDRLVGLTGAAALLHEPVVGAPDPLAVARAVARTHRSTRVITLGAPASDLETLESIQADAGTSGSGTSGAASETSPADAAVIFFTSGTTGTPKGPVGRHADLAEGWDGLAGELGFGPDDVHLGHLPLTHGFGMSLAYMALATGGRIVLTPRFSADEALRLITREAITVLNGTPTHFILLTSRLDRAHHDVKSLRIGVGSAASFPPQLLRRIFDDLGMDLALMYGSSEGVGVTTTDREDILRGAVGRPPPGFVSIVGPDRRPVPLGQLGEIAFNRDMAEVEYWSAEVDGGGDGGEPPVASSWYHSGDLGRLDADGRLYVVGRLKHQIDRGGLKVDPGEVEQALLRLPAVLDAAVIGAPNPVLGESVCACVVPASVEPPTLAGLRRDLSAGLAPHKLPEELCVLDAIPRTPLGKIDRRELLSIAMGDTRRERLRAG